MSIAACVRPGARRTCSEKLHRRTLTHVERAFCRAHPEELASPPVCRSPAHAAALLVSASISMRCASAVVRRSSQSRIGNAESPLRLRAERSRRLRARALASVEIGWKAEHEACNLMLIGDRQQSRRVRRELCPPDRLECRSNRARHIGEREAERFCSGIDADEPASRREMGREILDIGGGNASLSGRLVSCSSSSISGETGLLILGLAVARRNAFIFCPLTLTTVRVYGGRAAGYTG